MKTAMPRLPAVLVWAIEDYDKPLWRISEGLHHLKVELTYLLTDQPTADRGGKKQPIMSKGAGKKKPAPPAGEWARQPQPAERLPTSLPALKETAPPPHSPRQPPPATILFKWCPMTSTPLAYPPKKMPSRPVPTTKQPVPEPMPPGANVFPVCTAYKKKEPKKPLTANQRRHHKKSREVRFFMAPSANVAPVKGVPTPSTPVPMETNQPPPPPPQIRPLHLKPVPRKPWTGNYHTWQLETRRLYKEYRSGEIWRLVYPDGSYADLQLLTARWSDYDTIQTYDQQTTTCGESYICRHQALPEYAYIRDHWARARTLSDHQRNRVIANFDTGMTLVIEPPRD